MEAVSFADSGCLFGIGVKAYHPVDAEFVGEHAKVVAPEGVGQRHGYLTAIGERIEQTICFFLAVRRN